MREKTEDQSLKPDECTSEKSKRHKRKITYTRTSLLSLHDWETCSDLPSDFDSSVLQELYDDGSIGTLEHPSTDCSMSICSSNDSEYGRSQSFRCNDQDLLKKCTKWDGHSSWLKNKDNNSKRNNNAGRTIRSDSSSQESSRKLMGQSSGMKNKDGHSSSNQESDFEKSYKDRQVFSSENPDKDAIQGIPVFPSVSESTASVLSPVVQVQYQLKKCDNPYRPPHMCKGKSGKDEDTLKSGKGSPVTSSSDEQQNKKQSAKRFHDSDQTGKSGIRMINSTVNMFSSEEVPDNLICLSLSSFEAINKSEVCVDQENRSTYHGDNKVTGGMNSDKGHEEAEVKSGSSTILSKNYDVEANNTLGPMLRHNKLISSCNIALIDEKGARNGHTDKPPGFSCSAHFKEMEGGSTSLNQNTRVAESLKPTSRTDFLEESRPHEPAISVQIGSINLNVRQDSSESCVTQDLDYSFLLSILDDSEAFEKSGDSFLLSILDDSGAFDLYSEIIRARKASMEPKVHEHEDENEDTDNQNIRDKISSIVTTEQVPKSSPLALSDGEVDFNELCLPDEDSLITIDDLISPLSLEPPNEITTLALNPAEIHAHDSQSELSSGQDYTAPSHILPRNNIPPPPNLNLYKNIVYYSVLDQPGNLVQQTEGVASPVPMEQLNCYNNGPHTACFYPHLYPSYQMFGRPNTDLGGFGGNNSRRALVNGSAGPMHPFGIAGYGQRYISPLSL